MEQSAHVYASQMFSLRQDHWDNFPGDNTLSARGETVSKLIDALELQSNIAIDWFTKNEMIINPGKFKTIILNKKTSNPTNIPLTIDN